MQFDYARSDKEERAWGWEASQPSASRQHIMLGVRSSGIPSHRSLKQYFFAALFLALDFNFFFSSHR
jgi:hypothetical protein